MKINPETKEVTYTWAESLALYDAIDCGITSGGIDAATQGVHHMMLRYQDKLITFAEENNIPPGSYNPEELFK